MLSHLGLRRAIGIIGIALPFVLAFGKMLSDGPGIESSISSYYHTGMRDVFVGAMCAIAILLFAYKGYDYKDVIAGKLGALFAVGVALVPTAPESSEIPEEIFIGNVHLAFAGAFFLTLAYFSLYLFTKTHPHHAPTRQKRLRNRIYKVCGALITVTLLFIAVVKLLPDLGGLGAMKPVFWLESVAVVAFGISWLTKGEILFRDASAAAAAPWVSRHS
ncbi:MAG TPA: DUF998 domain-containing protein [Gammaproteobacteria bacterium]